MQCYLITDNIPNSLFCYVGITKNSIEVREHEHWLSKNANIYKKNWLEYLKFHNYSISSNPLGSLNEYEYIANYAKSNQYISLNDFKQQSYFNKKGLSTEEKQIDILNIKKINYEKHTLNGFRGVDNKPILYAKPLYLMPEEEVLFKNAEIWLSNYFEYGDRTLFSIDELSIKNTYYFKQEALYRDAFLQYSAQHNKFYFDFYTKLLVENAHNKRWNLIDDFNEIYSRGFPFHYQDIKRFLKTHKISFAILNDLNQFVKSNNNSASIV